MIRIPLAILAAFGVALAVFLLSLMFSGGSTSYGQTTGLPAAGAFFGTILGARAGRGDIGWREMRQKIFA